MSRSRPRRSGPGRSRSVSGLVWFFVGAGEPLVEERPAGVVWHCVALFDRFVAIESREGLEDVEASLQVVGLDDAAVVLLGEAVPGAAALMLPPLEQVEVSLVDGRGRDQLGRMVGGLGRQVPEQLDAEALAVSNEQPP